MQKKRKSKKFSVPRMKTLVKNKKVMVTTTISKIILEKLNKLFS